MFIPNRYIHSKDQCKLTMPSDRFSSWNISFVNISFFRKMNSEKKHVRLWYKLPEEIKGIINNGFTNSLKNEKFFATHLRLETLHFKNITKKVIKLYSVSYSDHSYHIKVRSLKVYKFVGKYINCAKKFRIYLMSNNKQWYLSKLLEES